MTKLTQAKLMEMLDYNPETGVFVWKSPSRYRPDRLGEVAGHTMIKGYRTISVGGKLYLASRLAWLYMTGSWPKKEIDHIDLNRGNDVFSNLREANRQENCANRRMNKNNTSGIKGVDRRELVGGTKFRAQILVGGKKISLGHFLSAGEAGAAYAAAAKKYFGEFARS